MNIDKNHILKLADLAKITIEEDEIQSYISEINKIIELVSDVKSVDTSDVEPLSNVLDQLSSLRPDDETLNLDRQNVLDNAPEKDGVHFEVPPTIKHNNENKNEGQE